MVKTALTQTIKGLRKQNNMTQTDLALKAGVGLCFVRELEQGKNTVRMDKVNQVLNLFGYELSATKIDNK
ncbi:MAG: helix-turn-helix transcriptional regulator [Paludibacteraceae bacterium]|nr:helix-turn-helix transcriptional regulator [Paludibacteraceae bacterium]